jgi:hypothetical protein
METHPDVGRAQERCWKSAGTHFHLAGVLTGLLYKECELYMDNILPFADNILPFYFRDHVPNFSVLAIPLQKLVVDYTKSMRNRKVKLKGSALATFIHLKDLIDCSQKLFYFDIEEGDHVDRHMSRNATPE